MSCYNQVFFHKLDDMGNNANIDIRGFTMRKQRIKYYPSEYWTQDLWSQVQYSPFWAHLAFACKTVTLGCLYSHALSILTKSSKSKIKWCINRSLKTSEVAHTRLAPKRVLDLVQRSWVQSSLGVTFCHWNFLFLRSKASDANISIFANVVCLWKTRLLS